MVSEEEFRGVFGLDKDRRPLEYIKNNFEVQGEEGQDQDLPIALRGRHRSAGGGRLRCTSRHVESRQETHHRLPVGLQTGA